MEEGNGTPGSESAGSGVCRKGPGQQVWTQPQSPSRAPTSGMVWLSYQLGPDAPKLLGASCGFLKGPLCWVCGSLSCQVTEVGALPPSSKALVPLGARPGLGLPRWPRSISY